MISSSVIKCFCLVLFITLAGASELMAQRVEMEMFTLRAAEGSNTAMKPGDDFEVGIKVKNRDAGTLTYVLRTAEPVAANDAPPNFDHYNRERQLAYVEENGDVQLREDGAHDLAQGKNTFLARLSTRGWKPGVHELRLYAHNSTDRKHGDYEMASASFAVEVGADHVRLIDREKLADTRIIRSGFSPPVVKAGDKACLGVAVTGTDLVGLRVVTPMRLPPKDALPDFRYDPETRQALLADPDAEIILANGKMDRNPAQEIVEVELSTVGAAPGLYFATVTALTSEGRPDERHLALKVAHPSDRLKTEVSDPWIARDGSSAGRFTRLPDGRLIYGGCVSADNGLTWKKQKGERVSGGCPVLRDGRVMNVGYSQLPVAGELGWYASGMRSKNFTDGGEQRHTARFHVPLAKAAMGHAPHKGPLCTGSFAQRDDGVLLALMMGWFEGDDKLCPYGRGRPYSRSYLCESADGGLTWRYLSTLGYDEIGSEGYNEGSIQKLPNGELVAVLRTGNMNDRAWHDNPVMVTRSADGGRTWLKPWRTGVNGCYPDLALLSGGMLALSAGRPGAYVLFSSDNGDTWHDLTLVDAAYYSGYTALIETRPGELLVAFGEGYERPNMKNHVRMAHVRYQVSAELR
ncbi:MAG: sialidase family protein [Kiritimatiellae bacterium]|nr:sialidase family protein [Kiritimatiellia bacterium]